MTGPHIDALARATTTNGVRDGVCRWFGGPYDPNTRSYRTPQVAHLGVVRRARPKSEDKADYYLGATSSGAVMGSSMLVHVDSGVESRAAIAGAFGGMKFLQSAVMLHVFMRSDIEWAEDAQDAFYDLLDALKARIRADRCMGTGGWEQGGFDVGEGDPWLRWSMAPAETTAERTTGYLAIEFSARYYVEG
jgi:hypothetical protein